MTDKYTPLREALEKATRGPWEASNYLVFFANNAGGFSLSGCPDRNENAAAIALAVNAAPALLAERDALREALSELIDIARDGMLAANNDGGLYDIESELKNARAALQQGEQQ